MTNVFVLLLRVGLPALLHSALGIYTMRPAIVAVLYGAELRFIVPVAAAVEMSYTLSCGSCPWPSAPLFPIPSSRFVTAAPVGTVPFSEYFEIIRDCNVA